MARITSKITSIEQSKSVSELAASLGSSENEAPLELGEQHKISTPDKSTKKQIEKPTAKPVEQPSAPTRISQPPRAAYVEQDRPQTSSEPQNFGWVRAFTIISILIWLTFSSLLCFSVLDISKNAGTYSALQWLGVIGMVAGPIFLIWVTAYSLKQLARLSAQANALTNVANSLTQPDQTVIRKSKVMSAAITAQVDDVNEKLSNALGRLATMEDVLNVQTSSLAQSNIDATKTTDYISTNLQAQNAALDKISSTFDDRMLALSQVITGHTDKLAKATHLAEQKIKEARISVEGATAKINSASDIVRTNTVQAASTLSASHADISSLGDIIRERSKELDTVYKKHANDLTAMIEHLRDEQQNLGAVLEERLTKMRDLSLSAQASAESLIDASVAGKDTVEALAKSASLSDTAVKARFAEMKDMVRYSNEHAQSISDKAAQRVKDSLEQTRKEIGRIEDDMADLQNKISSANLKSLELVPESEEYIPEVETPRNPTKNKRTRLKIKPVKEKITLNPIPDFLINEEDNIAIPEPETTPEPPKEKPPQDEVLDIYTETETEIESEPKVYQPEKFPPKDPLPPVEREDTETVLRATPQYESDKKQGFSLRGLFGGRREGPDASLSIVDDSPPKPMQMPTPLEDAHKVAKQESQTKSDTGILQALDSLGLAPNAVVDDGCIIEAANSRASSGHEAMSRIVAQRLNGPVLHLSKAMSLDAQLSQNAIGFASNFDQSIENLSGNREAIRTRLEDEHGRAYLLCDAALNYGRV